MKNVFIVLCLMVCGVLFFSSCDDDTFCIDNVTISATLVDISDVTIVLPTDVTHSGRGLSNYAVQIGEYDMILESVTISQVENETGADITLIHYFKDGNGNNFWSEDDVALVNTGEIGKATSQFTLNIVGGNGDFECPTGTLAMDFWGDFINNKLTATISGNICGGCE